MRELREDAIVDFGKNKLRDIGFVAQAEYGNIERQLDVIADTKQARYRKMEAAKWLWKFFLKKCLGDITDNLRGYDELCRYFDDYAEYENLLLAVDNNHRDHVIHSIWVMLLGLFLKDNFDAFAEMEYSTALSSPHYQTEQARKQAAEAIKTLTDVLREKEVSLWCLIALTHDLGYPIEKTVKANELMTRMVSNFGFLEQQSFQYNFKIVHHTAISALLNMVACRVAWTPQESYKLIHIPGHRLDYGKSFEWLEHGIMSAYLLMTHLDYVCDLLAAVPEEPIPETSIGAKSAAKTATAIVLLKAISSHTNRNAYHRIANNMSTLLLLSDELDEFSRYSRSLRSGEWVSVRCRTEFEAEQNSLLTKYTFVNQDIGDDMEPFFKGKVEKLWNRFGLPHEGQEGYEIKNMSITCHDVRKADTVQFTYNKTLSRDPSDIVENVERQPGNSSKNIQGFLDGVVDLSA